MPRKFFIILIIIPILISATASYLIIKNKSLQIGGTDRLPTKNIETTTYADSFSFPEQTASPEEHRRFYQLMYDNASTASAITLTNCVPEPKIIKRKLADILVFKNTDSIPRTIMVNETTIYTIPANQEISIKITFHKGRGTYGYRCDDSESIVGVIVVE